MTDDRFPAPGQDWREKAWEEWAWHWWRVLPIDERSDAPSQHWRISDLDESLAKAWIARAAENPSVASEELMTAVSSPPPPEPVGVRIGDQQLSKLFDSLHRSSYTPKQRPFGALDAALAPRLQAAIATVAEQEVTQRALLLLSEVSASSPNRASEYSEELGLGTRPAPEEFWPEALRPLRAAYIWNRSHNQTPSTFWEQLEADIRALQASPDDFEREALVARIRDAAAGHPDQFALAIPWFLSRRQTQRDDLIAQLAGLPPVRAALAHFAAATYGATSLRAEGVLAIVNRGHVDTPDHKPRMSKRRSAEVSVCSFRGQRKFAS